MGKPVTVLIATVCVMSLLLAGCASMCPDKAGNRQAKAGQIVLCGKCGQVKGSAACCKPGAQACAGCGLQKGSPGCCAGFAKGADVTLCGQCGFVKGSAACCKPGTGQTCALCGFIKGSPGCKAKCGAG